MKQFTISALLLSIVFVLIGCNNNTYSDDLKEEQKLIENFIQRQGIQVVTEEPSEWADNVYWKLPDYDNYYFHLVQRGDTTSAELEAKDKVLLRYRQYTLDAYADTISYWPTLDSPKYEIPFSINRSQVVTAIAYRDGKPVGEARTKRF